MAQLRPIATGPRRAEVYNLEGRILHAAGRLPDAATAFKASLALDQNQPGDQQQLAMVLLTLGRRDEGHRRLLLAEKAGDGDARFLIARLALEHATTHQEAASARAAAEWMRANRP